MRRFDLYRDTTRSAKTKEIGVRWVIGEAIWGDTEARLKLKRARVRWKFEAVGL